MFLFSWLTKGVHTFFGFFFHSSQTTSTNGNQTASSSTISATGWSFNSLWQRLGIHRDNNPALFRKNNNSMQPRDNNQRGGLQEAFRELIESLVALLGGISSQASNPFQNLFPRRRPEDMTETNGNNNSITGRLIRVIQALLRIVMELVKSLGPNNNRGTTTMTSNPGIGFNNDPSPGSIPQSFGGFGYGSSNPSVPTFTERGIGSF